MRSPRRGWSGSGWVVRFAVGVVALGCSCESKPKATEPCRQIVDGEIVCGDFSNALGTTDSALIVGRLLEEEEDFVIDEVTPAHDLELDEIEDARAELRLSNSTGELVRTFSADADHEGWIRKSLALRELNLRPGRYRVDVFVGDAWAARVPLRLVAPTHSKAVVVSDIDLTYLDTDFQTAEAMANLMRQKPRDRVTLPGMHLVYAALRAEDERPITFLSGSPLFFQRTLAAKLRLDGVEHDGMMLKPFKLLLLHQVLGGLDVDDLLAALGGSSEKLLGSLVDQVGYKLAALFSHQLRLPRTAPMILMGDDSEADHVVYNLFHRYMAGELSDAGLSLVLEDLKVDDTWIEAVGRTAPLAKRHRGSADSPVAAVFINKTHVASKRFPVEDWALEDLYRHHSGSWPLALSLRAEGWLVDADLERLLGHLLQQTDRDVLKKAATDGVAEGFLSEELVAKWHSR